MLDSILNELLAVVLGRFIQTHYMRHSKVSEDLQVVLWIVAMPLILGRAWSLLNRSHEGYELSWYHPVEISILYFLVVFIFSWIKVFKTVPPKSYCYL